MPESCQAAESGSTTKAQIGAREAALAFHVYTGTCKGKLSASDLEDSCCYLFCRRLPLPLKAPGVLSCLSCVSGATTRHLNS